ncbi:MAG: CPBP family intramembrane glutamic endopeptidase [Pseudomonadota bacterium]
MLDAILVLSVQVAILGGCGIFFGLLAPKDFKPLWLIAAVVVYVVSYIALTRGFYSFSNPPWASLNWYGKILSTLVALAVAAIPAIGFKRSGMTLKQLPGSWTAWLFAAVVLGVVTYFAATDGYVSSNLEAKIFQWTMPGLDEELLYRGVLLLMLNEALRSRVTVLGARMGWAALITSILFGAVHGVAFDDGVFQFTLPWSQTLSGLVLVWIRERTGSVILPILGHNYGNAIFLMV